MKSNLTWLYVIAVAAAILIIVFNIQKSTTQTPKEGETAPTFKATSEQGNTLDIAELTKQGPVFIYFISTTCPVTEEATPYLKKIADAVEPLGGKFIGVVNKGTEETIKWKNIHSIKFDLIPDEQYKIINEYGVKAAPAIAIIGKGGKLIKLFTGYSESIMTEAIQIFASENSKEPPKVDLSGSPKKLQFG